MSEKESERLTIKSWAEEDRPREKFILKGKQTLSDAELIAILISSGNSEETAVELSQRILKHADNNLHQLSRMNVKELMEFKGIGEAKALAIAAALELGRRRKETEGKKGDRIISSKEAVDIFQPLLGDNLHEEFWILFLNRANHVISKKQISSGGMAGTVVDSKIIFKNALDEKASSIILCHNHPSGNIQPSEEDKKLTKKIIEAGKVLEIAVLDHVIVSHSGYFSFADEGLM
jgi:DNA repair protein RadC